MNRFKEGRLKKGLTQIELAKLLGVDRSTISRWENGDTLPRLERLIYLSKLFDIDLQLLCNSLSE